VTHIYSQIISLFLFLILSTSYGADALTSYCFESETSLELVKESIGFILLEKDSVSLRKEDHCVDVISSDKRKIILDKYISKKYKLVAESPKEVSECHIQFRTITKKKLDSNDFKLGTKNSFVVNEASSNGATTAEMLLGAGFPGKLSTGDQTLQVECRPSGSESFELTFYFEEKNKAQVSTSVRVNKNEILNLASVKKLLDEKNKTLGIPQTTIKNEVGSDETNYELKVY